MLATLPDDLRRRARLASPGLAAPPAAPEPVAAKQDAGETPFTVPISQKETEKAPIRLDIEL